MITDTQNKSTLNPDVIIIPASRPEKHRCGLKGRRSIRVAAYCRVSTGDESQHTSYTMQKNFYTSMIKNKKGWRFANIYADEAISGTSRTNRKEFNRMIQDALGGKFDYIITKSISRFARNTIDTLDCVRQLKQLEPPVGIYFEKENIDTLDAAGELILTILSALAQDESRSISENIRWSLHKNFQSGKPQINLGRMLGYDKGENNKWVINKEQADIVRYIFTSFEKGMAANKIASELNAAHKYTVQGNIWRADSVYTVLQNEKYVGDLEMQKTVTENFLTHRSVENNGTEPKYYIKDHHSPIIDRELWEKVQELIKQSRTSNSSKRGAKASVFYNLYYIDRKGTEKNLARMMYKRTAAGYTDERALTEEEKPHFKESYSYAYPVWRGKDGKSNITLCECAIEQSFMEMLYYIKKNPSYICDKFINIYKNIHTNKEEYSVYDKPKLIEMQISHLEGIYKHSEDDVQKSNIKLRISGLKEELKAAEGGIYSENEMQNNFKLFMEYIDALPEHNEAGDSLCIYGIDKSQGNNYDYIPFDKLIYMKFIKKGIVIGDNIYYMTTFGAEIKSIGNLRKLNDFIGYKKTIDNKVQTITSPWQIYNNKIQYTRTKIK